MGRKRIRTGPSTHLDDEIREPERTRTQLSACTFGTLVTRLSDVLELSGIRRNATPLTTVVGLCDVCRLEIWACTPGVDLRTIKLPAARSTSWLAGRHL